MNSTSVSMPNSLDHAERIHIKHLVRHHVHDVRNYINCANMEASLLSDGVTDSEIVEGLNSISQQLRDLDKIVTSFAAHFKHFPDPEDQEA